MIRDGDWRELDLYLEMLTRLFLISFHIIHRSEQWGADLLPRWGARIPREGYDPPCVLELKSLLRKYCL